MTIPTFEHEILTRIPGYESAQKRESNARDQKFGTKRADPDAVFVKLREQASAILEKGDEVPDDFAAPYVKALRDKELYDARTNILALIEGPRGQFLDAFKMTHADKILDALRDELDATVDSVKDLASALNNVRNADDAIAEGAEASEAWRLLKADTERYRNIRAMQFDLYAKREGGLHTEFPGMTIREALDVEPYYVARRRTNAQFSYTNTAENRAYVDWMREAKAGWDQTIEDPIFPTQEAEPYLLMLVRRYTLWIPSMSERTSFVGRAATATARVQSDDAVQYVNARRDAYLTAGVSNQYTKQGAAPVKQVRVMSEPTITRARAVVA
jgi:hypothetical protein